MTVSLTSQEISSLAHTAEAIEQMTKLRDKIEKEKHKVGPVYTVVQYEPVELGKLQIDRDIFLAMLNQQLTKLKEYTESHFKVNVSVPNQN